MSTARRALGAVLATVTALAVAVIPGASAAPISVNEVYPVPPNGVFTLDGHGYGHGHGMSQFGAYGAALKGLTYQQIVGFYYPHTTLTQQPNSTVRVLVSAAQGAPLTIEPRAGVDTSVSSSVAGVAACTLPTSYDGGKTTVQRWRAKVVSTTNGPRLRLQKTVDGSTWTVGNPPNCDKAWSAVMNGSITFTTGGYVRLVVGSSVRRYRGAMRAAFTGTSIYPVDVVPIESYLRSVVPSEMPSSWSAAALEAQAVAARTYAAYVHEHPHPGVGAYFDLYDTTSDQMYTGMSSEVTSTNDAVAATAGNVLLDSQGHAAFTQFSSSSGGWTVAGGQPYLIAQQDPYDGVPSVSWSPHSWRTTLSASTIRSVYSSLGAVTSIVITGRDGNGDWGGRVTSLTVHGSSGSVTVSGTSFRSTFGLRSEWFRVVLPPNVPTYVRASRSGGSATVTWRPPKPNGGAPVSGYQVVLQPGSLTKTVSASTRSASFSGLASGTDYVAEVAARSDVGRGRYATVTTKVDRLGTSSAAVSAARVSAADFTAGSAGAVVLTSTTAWANGLAAGPLAVALHGPVLLTDAGSVPSVTMAEIQRVLPAGGRVYLLGNTGVISDDVKAAVAAKGFRPVRLGGATPAATARAVANKLASTTTIKAVVEVDDGGFTDAWAATPLAVRKHAAILLTHAGALAPETRTWLANHPGLTRFAVGAAAHQADTSATAYFGGTAAQTAAAVATATFGKPGRAGVVAAGNATSGLVEAVRLRGRGPLLYAAGSSLPAETKSVLHTDRTGLALVDLTGSGLPYYDVESAVQGSLLP
ncbi:MAG TPA: SpoIID/LytB domain-containing protein [Mycobacteriales bacterium]|nr:SpoIID/LytB domain-containing protein [Mycobacteriales bacterium]